MSTFDGWLIPKFEQAVKREDWTLEQTPKGKRLRETQFRGYASALHKEITAIHYEGFTNHWASVDIDRRVTQAIARRAHDLVAHTVGSMSPIALQCCTSDEEVVHDIPDMTELPKEETEA